MPDTVLECRRVSACLSRGRLDNYLDGRGKKKFFALNGRRERNAHFTSLNLLEPELFFFNLAYSVYKM